MILYITVILLGMVGIAVMNYFVFMPETAIGFPLWLNIVGVVVSTIAVIAIDGGLAAIAHKFQNKINPFSKYFNVSKKEKRRLEKIGVRKFKDFLPDLGFLAKFPKGEVAQPKNKDYVYLYIMESCSGEIGHLLGTVLGFLIIFLFPLKYVLCFGVPVGIVNFVLSLLPVFSLRYNRYKLTIVYRKLEKDESVGLDKEEN